jgi:AraC-like DNA-binding protein
MRSRRLSVQSQPPDNRAITERQPCSAWGKAALAGAQQPLEEIAALLGLADEAGLAAATRRWFEQSPAEFREQHGPGLQAW